MFLKDSCERDRLHPLNDVRWFSHSIDTRLWLEIQELLLGGCTEQVRIGCPVVVNGLASAKERSDCRGHVAPVYHGDWTGDLPLDLKPFLGARPDWWLNVGAKTADIPLGQEKRVSPLVVGVITFDESRRLGRLPVLWIVQFNLNRDATVLLENQDIWSPEAPLVLQ